MSYEAKCARCKENKECIKRQVGEYAGKDLCIRCTRILDARLGIGRRGGKKCLRCHHIRSITGVDENGNEICNTCCRELGIPFKLCSRCQAVKPLVSSDHDGSPLCLACSKIKKIEDDRAKELRSNPWAI